MCFGTNVLRSFARIYQSNNTTHGSRESSLSPSTRKQRRCCYAYRVLSCTSTLRRTMSTCCARSLHATSDKASIFRTVLLQTTKTRRHKPLRATSLPTKHWSRVSAKVQTRLLQCLTLRPYSKSIHSLTHISPLIIIWREAATSWHAQSVCLSRSIRRWPASTRSLFSVRLVAERLTSSTLWV